MIETEKFKVVGEETRLRILRVLVKADIGLCECEIIDILQKPQYNISKHLNILKRSGLIKDKRYGRKIIYSLVKSNKLNIKIFEAVKLIKTESDIVFRDDYRILGERLKKRINGKCDNRCC